MKFNFGERAASIRTKIGLLFGCSMVLLFVIFSGLMYYQISSTVVPMTAEYSQEIVAMVANRVGDLFTKKIEAVKTEAEKFLNGMMVDLSTMPEAARKPYIDLLEETMVRMGRKLNPDWISLAFVDPLGTGYFQDGTRRDVTAEEYVQSVIANGSEIYIGNPFIHPDTGEAAFIVASQVINYNNERVGALAATVRLAEVSAVALDARIGESGYGTIIDSSGTVVVHPDPEVAFSLNLFTSAEQGYDGFVEIGEQIANGAPGFKIVSTPSGASEAVIHAPIPGSPGWVFTINIPDTVMTNRINRVFRFMVWAVIIITLVALSIVYFVSGSITRPIMTVAACLDRVARGDFSGSLPWKRKDEIGRIAAAFNQMSARLREMIQEVGNITQQVSYASQQLSAVSEENSASIDEVASTTNEFASTAESVSDDVQNMVARAQAVKEISDRGFQQIQLSGETMGAIAHSSDESQKAMETVQEAAEKISSIVSLISDIAEQTNLLALNAAIEAARAGEHGRGFAVVADEVRSLSMETKKSVTEIRHFVEALTVEVKRAAQVIGQTDEEIAKGSRVLQETQAGFTEIAESINDVVATISHVADAAQALGKGSQEIASATEQQSASMEEIARSASTLADMARRLDELMNSFKIS